MSKPSRFSRPTRLAVLALSLALLVAPIGMAIAQNRTLDAPRSAGTVGERYDGYAVVRDPAQAASLAPVVDQVGRVYAAEILKSAPSGTWFLQESGQWTRK